MCVVCCCLCVVACVLLCAIVFEDYWLFVVGLCSLPVVRCLSFAGCRVLFAVRGSLCVVCCVFVSSGCCPLFAIRRMLFVSLLFVVCVVCMACVVCCWLFVIRCVSMC